MAKPLSASRIADICSNVWQDYVEEHNVSFGVVTLENGERQYTALDEGQRSALRAMEEMKRRLIAVALEKES